MISRFGRLDRWYLSQGLWVFKQVLNQWYAKCKVAVEIVDISTSGEKHSGLKSAALLISPLCGRIVWVQGLVLDDVVNATSIDLIGSASHFFSFMRSIGIQDIPP